MVNFANHLNHQNDVRPNIRYCLFMTINLQGSREEEEKNYCEFEFKLIISTFTFYIYGCWLFILKKYSRMC